MYCPNRELRVMRMLELTDMEANLRRAFDLFVIYRRCPWYWMDMSRFVADIEQSSSNIRFRWMRKRNIERDSNIVIQVPRFGVLNTHLRDTENLFVFRVRIDE